MVIQLNITPELSFLLFRVRERVQSAMATGRSGYVQAPRNHHQYLFIQLRKWFPDSKERDIRIAIIEALVGLPIGSQKDLNTKIINVLMEVLKDDSKYLTTELCAELSDAVESTPYGTSWAFPAAPPEDLAVSNLSLANQTEPEHGST